MAKKWPGEWPQPHEFSQLYREKKARIQERGCSGFIEFLNWVENVNKWEKKEDWKRLVDQWFNKYSDDAIVRLFNMFVDLKENRSKWFSYEDILDKAKSTFTTEIYGENIVRQLFGWYGNYLKYLKRRRGELALEKTAKASHKNADKVKKQKKEEVKDVLQSGDEWAENHYWGNDRDIVNEDGDVVLNPEHEHVSLDSNPKDYSVEVLKMDN